MNLTATLVLVRHEGEPVVLSPRPLEMERHDNLVTNASEVKWDGTEIPDSVNWQESTIRLATEEGNVVGVLATNAAWGLTVAQESAGLLEIPVTALIAAPGRLILELLV